GAVGVHPVVKIGVLADVVEGTICLAQEPVLARLALHEQPAVRHLAGNRIAELDFPVDAGVLAVLPPDVADLIDAPVDERDARIADLRAAIDPLRHLVLRARGPGLSGRAVTGNLSYPGGSPGRGRPGRPWLTALSARARPAGFLYVDRHAGCSTTPSRARHCSPPCSGSAPSTLTRPADRARNPSRISIVVVLPAPFGPRSVTTSPVRMSKSMPSRTSMAPYRIRRSRTSAAISASGRSGILVILARFISNQRSDSVVAPRHSRFGPPPQGGRRGGAGPFPWTG